MQKIMVLGILLIVGSTQVLQAQTKYKILETKDIDMKLSGTSTLHNWTMETQTFTGEAQFGFKSGNIQLNSIKSLSFNLNVTDLKSGEKGLDKNAYKALKTDQYKDIVYKLSSAKVMSEKNGKYLIKTQGNLSIAGVTKDVAMDVYAVVNKDGSITCTGSDKLLMTDYQVKPPKFMLGAMKTGDAITLNYTIVYKKDLL
ncbi:MAG TPA: YceI family protein [Puia sp.]|nr:YceI family protein [Puia sp.]